MKQSNVGYYKTMFLDGSVWNSPVRIKRWGLNLVSRIYKGSEFFYIGLLCIFVIHESLGKHYETELCGILQDNVFGWFGTHQWELEPMKKWFVTAYSGGDPLGLQNTDIVL